MYAFSLASVSWNTLSRSRDVIYTHCGAFIDSSTAEIIPSFFTSKHFRLYQRPVTNIHTARRVDVWMNGEKDNRGFLEKIILTDIEVPFTAGTRRMKSGYAVAGFLAALTGGTTLAISYAFFLAVSVWLETPPILAALAAGLSGTMLDLFRINALSAYPSGEGLDTLLLPLVTFTFISAFTYGAKPEDFASGLTEYDSESMQAPSQNQKAASAKNSKKPVLGESASVEQFPDLSADDFQAWDEKFLKVKRTNKEVEEENKR